MPALEDLQEKQNELIRKVLAASLFFAPEAADLPTTLTSGASADLTALPTGYSDLGLVTKDDAYSWSRETEMAEVTSHGFTDPVRRDINMTVNSLSFSAQETNKRTLELYSNVDLTNAVPTPVTGEITYNEPLAPATRYYRVLGLGRDGVGSSAIYIAKIMPRAMVSETSEQAWSDTDELLYPMTITATPDTSVGYSIRHVFGGPGWRSLLVKMGFPAVTP